MLFFQSEVEGSGASKFKNISGEKGQLDALKQSFTDYVATVSLDLDKLHDVVRKQQSQMVGIDTAARNVLRSMGGVADFTGKGAARADEFRRTLSRALDNVISIGGSLKDVSEAAAGLAESMGRMVNPSAEVLANIVATSKAFGLTTKETSKMVTDIVRFGGTQEEALETMKGIANEARKSGINTAAYMKAVQGGLKMASGFGFKNGIDGLKNMAKQAAMLRTTIEGIGAKGLQAKVLDPEGAIEAAAGFQMLGGAIGKLGDPFQLLRMAQSDMEGLQDELAKSTASAFSFNKETGEFKASTQDLYRLRAQAELTGANFDEMLESGREMAKLDFIKNSVDLDGLTDDQKGVLSSLAQIDKKGKVQVDIPGFEEGTRDLTELMKDDKFKEALDQYQVDSTKSAKDIALEQMNIEDKQLAALQGIEKAVVLGMTAKQQDDLINAVESQNKDAADAYRQLTGKVEKTMANVAVGVTQGEASAVTVAKTSTTNMATEVEAAITNAGFTTMPDGFIPSNSSAPTILSKGAIYKGIVGDDVAVGVGLGDALSKASSGNLTGAIDININLNGSINGDPGQVAKMFNSPEIQKQIMDTVLYKLNDYKRQQGVLA